MKVSDEVLIELAYVKISSYRTRTVEALYGEIKVPFQIAEDSNILKNYISNTLGQLADHGLVECINPEAYRGRLYRLTEMGENVAEQLISD